MNNVWVVWICWAENVCSVGVGKVERYLECRCEKTIVCMSAAGSVVAGSDVITYVLLYISYASADLRGVTFANRRTMKHSN